MSPNSRVWIPGLEERPFDYDPVTGIRTFMSVGPKGEWQFRHEFESVKVELEASKALAKDEDHWKSGVKGGLVHYAHIPDSVLFKWHCEGVDLKDKKALFEMVNKPEWSYLKCVDKFHLPQG